MAKRELLWQVGCEGFFDVWVCAMDWPLATVEAAKIWDAPWTQVAAKCYLVNKKIAMNNVCAKCGRVYHGNLPLCELCKKVQAEEKRILAKRLGRYYQKMKVEN